ncbi:hypothetical protein [Rhizobium phaseoli]|uniref:Uncharacterized protein n=1 Tax=Rhizobium phaseoli TaxID=396 RepID=A0ABN4QUC2_9HYPH|nr:hypothetical protein [Rhizobium phaseoli]ANL89062.1 hypothetical protein AMC81_PE00819 [Rhizobium phaseoli]ANL95571.1 hypothetical protein AMC80_PE00819 [Rhizobium phaseoli]
MIYFVDAKSEMRRFRLDGDPDGVVDLPGTGMVRAVFGESERREAFFVYASPIWSIAMMSKPDNSVLA